MFLCRSIYDELEPEDTIMKGDAPYVPYEDMPVTLYKECCLGTHFTKFVAYMMWLGKFREDEARRYYEQIRRRFRWSVPSLLRLLGHRLLLVWYKRKPPKEKEKEHQPPTRDINGKPLEGEDVCS